MTSILISADDQTMGLDFAKNLATKINFKCLDRSFLKTVAERYKTTEEKLLKALNIPPSSRRLWSKNMEQHLAYIQASTLESLLDDNVVCEGLAAHFYVRGVSHILNVRLLSDRKAREEMLMQKKIITLKKARKILDRETLSELRWSQKAFNSDASDASLYDMVLSIEQMGLDKATEVVMNMAEYRKFKPMTYSIKCLQDLALASRLHILLLSRFSDFSVIADGSRVIVYIKGSKRQKAKTAGEIKVIANEIPEIGFVEVHVVSKLPSTSELQEIETST
jgi:cytidylate kinase